MTGSHPSADAVFIVLEGIDGSGTTTQLGLLAQHLERHGRHAVSTREPSTGPVGVLLRDLLLGRHGVPGGGAVDGRTMALLFAADRRDHLAREIEPALASGADVVSDRYLLSSLAYQAEEADQAWVETLATGVRVPDLTLLLDLPIALASERRARAGRAIERYDADRTLTRVANNYRRLAARASTGTGAHWGNVVVVDGSSSVPDVQRAIASEVDRLLADRSGG